MSVFETRLRFLQAEGAQNHHFSLVQFLLYLRKALPGQSFRLTRASRMRSSWQNRAAPWHRSFGHWRGRYVPIQSTHCKLYHLGTSWRIFSEQGLQVDAHPSNSKPPALSRTPRMPKSRFRNLRRWGCYLNLNSTSERRNWDILSVTFLRDVTIASSAF